MNALRVSTQRSYLQASRLNASRAAFSMSARSLAYKEDALNTDGRAEDIEYHKQDQLNKKKQGKQHWKDELASNSESIVKADRSEIDGSEDAIKKLQEESAKAAQQKS